MAAYKTATNEFTARINNGRAKRNCSSDLFFPPEFQIGSKVSRAFLFFPEMLVDHAAYAPIMSKISDGGILVAVANLGPLRKSNSSESIKNTKNVIFEVENLLGVQVDEWILGGHGFGADIFEVVKNTTQFSRVVLWNICEMDAIDSTISVLSIIASDDNVSKIELANKHPAHRGHNVGRIIRRIEGGNHSGFAHYGPQLFPVKDSRRTIMIEEQQELCSKWTIQFILK